MSLRIAISLLCATYLGLSPALGAPLITSVIETGGDSGQTPAKFTGQTFNHSAGLGSITVGLFGEDVPAYTDRLHQWNSVLRDGTLAVGMPPYLPGGEYIVPGNDRRDNPAYSLNVTISRRAFVYLLIDNRGSTTDGSASNPPDIGTGTNSLGLPFMQWVIDRGFAPVKTGMNQTGSPAIPDEVGVDTPAPTLGVGAGVSVDDYSSVYGKLVEAGSFTLGEYAAANNTGRNMYGVVVVEAKPRITVAHPAETPLVPESATVDFGTMEVGQPTAAAEFTIRNEGPGDLTDLSISFDDESIGGEFALIAALEVDTLAPGDSATFAIAFTPSATGTRTARLQVGSNDPEHPSFEVELTGTGVDTTPPMVGVPAEIFVAAGPTGTVAIGDLTANVTASDAGGSVFLTQDPVPGTTFGLGVHAIMFTVSDASMNTTTVHSTFRVAFAPVAAPHVTLSSATAGPGVGSLPSGSLVPGHGTGAIPAGATFGILSAPAISDVRQLVAKTTMRAGARNLGGIYREDGAGVGEMVAIQNGPALDFDGTPLAEALFKSFGEPVTSPAGLVAFTAKLKGAAAIAGDDGVWSDVFSPSGQPALLLREGAAVPGLGSAKLKAVTSLVLLDDALLALITLKSLQGVVTIADDTVLLRMTSPDTAVPLLRKGKELRGYPGTRVLGFTVLRPAAGSPGHARWHSADAVVAKVVLTINEVWLVSIAADGTITRLLSTSDPATPVSVEARWKSFGLPAIASNGSLFAVAGNLLPLPGVVAPKNDAVIVTSPDGTDWSLLAREDDPISFEENAPRFASFSHPVVNGDGRIAFVASLRGTGVNLNNGTALFYGDSAELQLAARLGGFAPDEGGTPTSATWSRFISHALPDGTGVVFMAETKGGDTTAKNKQGLWAAESSGQIRRVLRLGTPLEAGGPLITKIKLLGAVPGAYGAARSYNATNSLAAAVMLSDRTQVLVRIELPE